VLWKPFSVGADGAQHGDLEPLTDGPDGLGVGCAVNNEYVKANNANFVTNENSVIL
jgi:hypothetical protein